MKTYHGWRDADGLCHITVREPFRRNRPLESPRGQLASPTGFDWGSAGSGPAQTAFALLADTLGDHERALRLHQHFKFAVIGHLNRLEPWEMTEAEIMESVARVEGYPPAPLATERLARRPAGLRRPTRPSRRPSKGSGSSKRTKRG